MIGEDVRPNFARYITFKSLSLFPLVNMVNVLTKYNLKSYCIPFKYIAINIQTCTGRTSFVYR